MTTFSNEDYNSATYNAYRPTYSPQLFEKVYAYHDSHSRKYDKALDVATGTGQVAHVLSSKFTKVYATDVSQIMLSRAVYAPNISYSISTAENLYQFSSSMVDLITVGQAAHWFRIQEFFKEANRVLAPNGTLAIWAYSFHIIDGYPEATKMLIKFGIGDEDNELGKYWEEGRQVVSDLYRSFVVPENLFTDVVELRQEGGEGEVLMEKEWSLEQMVNYMKTWSSYKNYMTKNKPIIQQDPVDKLINKMRQVEGWDQDQKLKIIWPMVLILATKRE